MSIDEISNKFNVKKSYISSLIKFNYRRNDINYEEIDELLKSIDISDFFNGDIPEEIVIAKKIQKISSDDLIKIREDWKNGLYKTYKEVGELYNITGQYARSLILGTKGKTIIR